MPRNPRDLTALAHAWLAPVLAPGGRALDATCGNGHDTLFLARSVAPGGVVHAFDLQAEAIERARRRLETAAPAATVHWHEADHATLARVLSDAALDAAMFNLGWLPRGEKRLVTEPARTLPALDAALALLRPGGRLTVIAYRGHAGGPEEAAAVREWTERCGGDVRATVPEDPPAAAPILFVVERRQDGIRNASGANGSTRP